MDDEAIKLGLQALNMIGTFGLGAWMYIERRSDKTNDRVSELALRVEEIDRAVSSLQASAAAAPTHADLSKLHESVNELARVTHQLVGESRVHSDTLRLILNQITQKGMQ